ncbi:hypothetical protein PV783_34175 [Chitinophaga sp. CC14]|uniref:hypothetical protein n=1 Tax=Chitinophaga sp. CC14 TaxID=3029199 RepID=UPI003B75DF9C
MTLTKIWETDYARLIRAVYAEGTGQQTVSVDELVGRAARLVSPGARAYRLETETGALAGVLILFESDGSVLFSYLRPHFIAYKPLLDAMIA